MFTHLRSTLDNPSLFVIFSVDKRTQPNSLFSSTERFLWSRYPPYDVSKYVTNGEWSGLLIRTNDQEKKRKSFVSLNFPTVPARTAAGGYAGPKRWGPLLGAGIIVTSLAVLIGGRLHRT
jgi:hypothetical protein